MASRRCRIKQLSAILFLWVPCFLFFIKFVDQGDQFKQKHTVVILEEDASYGNLPSMENGQLMIAATYDRTLKRNHLGLGEGGRGVSVPYFQKKAEKAGYTQHAFNRVASDMISLQRGLQNYRNYK